jgi:aspartate racemase
MKKPKHIGIAAITAEGGALAYREIVHASELILGRDRHPEISLHSHSFSDYTESKENKNEVWSNLIIESSRKLAIAGAEFFICPANTNHLVFDLVQDRIAIPWLHIASMVSQQAQASGLKKSLLLGTKPLIQSEIYSKYFRANEIELVVPSDKDQDLVDRIIYEELIRGIISPATKASIVEMIKEYRCANIIDSVILGCTELPLLINNSDVEVCLLDSTRILARGAVVMATSLQDL